MHASILDRASGATRRFSRNASGSVTILFGVAVIVFMGCVGLAVDVARYYNVAAKMQDAIDSAALTGAKLLQDDRRSNSDIVNLVRRNFNAAMKRAGVKTAYVAPLKVTIDRRKSEVSADSRVMVKSFFGPIVNRPRMQTINKTTKVVYEMKKIELAMVLDITGSMLANNKLADMKTAANDVIDELFAEAINDDSIRIAVAPYSASVNAGSLAGAVSAAPNSSSASCVFRIGRGCRDASGVDVDTCVIERTGANAFTDAAPVGPDKLPGAPATPQANYSCPPSTVVPLLGRNQATRLKNLVNGYVAVGATAGHIGTAWGWYLLSPEWASVFPSESKPEPYSDENVNKSMIVMTDGLFNTSYTGGASATSAAQTEESYRQFRALCDSIKAKDVTIYTVGFDLADPRAQGELEACASTPSNFYDARTGAQLKEAFRAIADNLNKLRVAS